MAGKKKYLSVQIQGSSYSFDFAESEYDKKISHHTPMLRKRGLN